MAHPAVLPAIAATVIVTAILLRFARPGSGRWFLLHRYGCLVASLFVAAGLNSWVGWAWLTIEALVLPERLVAARPSEGGAALPTTVARVVDGLDSLSLVGAFIALAIAMRGVLRAFGFGF